MPLRILLIDDDPLVLKSLNQLFIKEGYEITSMRSSSEALRIYDQGLPYDLIITDIRMQGADGVEVLRHIRQTDLAQGRPMTPVIMMSAYGDDEKKTGSEPASHTGIPA